MIDGVRVCQITIHSSNQYLALHHYNKLIYVVYTTHAQCYGCVCGHDAFVPQFNISKLK